jgi:hypothetical protein
VQVRSVMLRSLEGGCQCFRRIVDESLTFIFDHARGQAGLEFVVARIYKACLGRYDDVFEGKHAKLLDNGISFK